MGVQPLAGAAAPTVQEPPAWPLQSMNSTADSGLQHDTVLLLDGGATGGAGKDSSSHTLGDQCLKSPADAQAMTFPKQLLARALT